MKKRALKNTMKLSITLATQSALVLHIIPPAIKQGGSWERIAHIQSQGLLLWKAKLGGWRQQCMDRVEPKAILFSEKAKLVPVSVQRNWTIAAPAETALTVGMRGAPGEECRVTAWRAGAVHERRVVLDRHGAGSATWDAADST